jgi:hypothetical protein
VETPPDLPPRQFATSGALWAAVADLAEILGYGRPQPDVPGTTLREAALSSGASAQELDHPPIHQDRTLITFDGKAVINANSKLRW